MENNSSILQLFGRLHTVVLHLPIGILVMAFLMELNALVFKSERYRPAIVFMLRCGIFFAIMTAFFGYLLAQEGGYEEGMIWDHKWAGITTAVLSIILYVSRKNKKLYWLVFGLLLIGLGITGHSGGSITHGSGFLSEPFETPEATESFTGNIDDVKVYSQLVQPIFKSKCVGCHNAGKVKGELIMTDTASILKGGKSGSMLVAESGKPALMSHRIRLPLEEKKHMPPKGKKQLSPDELRILEWWISSGAEFSATAGTYPKNEAVEQILKKKFLRKKSGLATLSVAAATSSQLATLASSGLNVFPTDGKDPWLEARLSNRKNLKPKDLKALRKVAEQVTVLDLGATDFSDDLADKVNDFPHLTKLFLDQTKLTDQGLQKIKPASYLKYLNLYACEISDKSIPHLKTFGMLKSLYLWQTNISDQGLAALKAALPGTKIISGKEQAILFEKAKLRGPKITSDSLIFSEKAEVSLNIKFPWAKVYYTLDDSDPDSLSQLYQAPFLIDETTNVKAIALAEGWVPSNIESASFFSSKKRPNSIKIDQQPNEKYKGGGAEGLIDLNLGSTNIKDGKWLGWQGKSVVATIAFASPTEVSKAFVSCMDDNGAWIFFPKDIEVLTSMDGRKYQSVAKRSWEIPKEQRPKSVEKLTVGFDSTTAKYVRVRIKNLTKNPKWHPAPGQPSWLFIDEIIIE